MFWSVVLRSIYNIKAILWSKKEQVLDELTAK